MGEPKRRRVLFVLLLIALPFICSCIQDESQEDQGNESGNSAISTLDEIRQQLDRPIRQPKATEPPQGNNLRDRSNNNSGFADPKKTALAEVRSSQAAGNWPPELNVPFPQMIFLTAGLQKRSLDEFRGRVVLIEYVSMASGVTQALAGSTQRGPYGAVPLRTDFKPFESYFPSYSGGIPAGDIVMVQILMLDHRSQSVTPEAATAWIRHFDLEARGRVVLIGSSALFRNGGSSLVGGFQLLDKKLVVRADATGDRARTVFTELFPLLPRYVRAPS